MVGGAGEAVNLSTGGPVRDYPWRMNLMTPAWSLIEPNTGFSILGTTKRISSGPRTPLPLRTRLILKLLGFPIFVQR